MMGMSCSAVHIVWMYKSQVKTMNLLRLMEIRIGAFVWVYKRCRRRDYS
jgi:hypothetical protein